MGWGIWIWKSSDWVERGVRSNLVVKIDEQKFHLTQMRDGARWNRKAGEKTLKIYENREWKCDLEN